MVLHFRHGKRPCDARQLVQGTSVAQESRATSRPVFISQHHLLADTGPPILNITTLQRSTLNNHPHGGTPFDSFKQTRLKRLLHPTTTFPSTTCVIKVAEIVHQLVIQSTKIQGDPPPLATTANHDLPINHPYHRGDEDCLSVG